MKTPKVDQKTCIGCVLCSSLAPKSFRMNDDYKAELIIPPGDSESEIQNAIDSCPVQAITQE
ncbi:MAG: ferredoxin [bacterium]|nr:ferredoxin [bacterium]